MEMSGEMELAAGAAPELPDDLVSMIITKMPFPAVFRARSLCRAWRGRLSPASALDDEDEKLLAASFQAEVRERSFPQGMLFPVCIGKELSIAYDWESKNWVQLPSLSFLPDELLATEQLPLGGAVDSGLVLETKRGPNEDECLIVANIFTGAWKSLPPRPGARSTWLGSVFSPSLRARLLRDSLTGSYKVLSLVFSGDGRFSWLAHIYDSRTNAWSTTQLHETVLLPWIYSAYLNGVFYMATKSGERHLSTLNMEDGTTSILELRYDNSPHPATSHLVVWDGQLFMLLCNAWDVRILKVDLESQQLLEVSRGPPDSFESIQFCSRPASIHGRHILFRQQGHYRRPAVAYDFLKDEWSLLEFPPLCTTSFKGASELLNEFDTSRKDGLTLEPGFNPFWQV